MKKHRVAVLRTLVVAAVVMTLALGLSTSAGAWSEGTDPNGWGTHDWILQTANELAANTGAGWVNIAAAQPVSDDPDTVYQDSTNHIYDRWGLVQIGSAHTTVRDRYAQAVAQLRAGNLDEASRQVAIMGHYYEDIWNPFHTSYELSTLSVQTRYHIRYEDDVLGHEPTSVAWDGFARVTDASAATVAAANVSRTYFSILSNAYTSGAGYGGANVDSTTKMLLGRAANGLADLIASIQADAGWTSNKAPFAKASATPTGGNPPLDVQFDSTGSNDPDGSIVSYLWDFGDGSTSTDANPSHTYATTGTRTAKLTVTDDGGATGTATVKIAVVNQPPQAVIGATPTSGKPPLDVQFDSAGSNDPDGSIVSYLWDFGDGSTSTDASPSHTYATTGARTARLTVTDDDGASGTATVTITTVNQPPKAVIGATPTSGVPPLEVTFSSAGSSDPDGSIVSYQWTFGDGSTSTDPNPSHTYTNAGTYTARLTVTDDNGATGTVTATIRTLPVIRVQSINMSVSSVWYYRTIRGSVLVTDTNGAPIGNATVKVTWSGTASGTATATTASNGIATFSKSFWAASGKATLTVTGVSKSGCTYDAAMNLETLDSISF